MLRTFFKPISFCHVALQGLVLSATSQAYNDWVYNVCLYAKYKQTNNISWEEAKPTIIEEHNDCIDSWCRKHGIKKSVHMEWKGKVVDNADKKIKTLSNETRSKFHKNVLP